MPWANPSQIVERPEAMDAKKRAVQSPRMMSARTHLLAPLLALSLGAGGCQRAETRPGAAPAPAAPAAATAPYAKDIDNLCNAVARSKSDQFPAGERAVPIAMWLGDTLKTDEARAFLVRIQPLNGEAKARALDDEARRVGLSGCPLSAEWRGP
jgi:hypothetical protein